MIEKTDRTAMVSVGYARVSTGEQYLSLRSDALSAAGCKRVFQAQASGVLASFRSLTDNIDTTSLGRAPRLPPVRAFAQFERDLIKERTRAGLLAAAARGRRGGRQSVVTPDKLE